MMDLPIFCLDLAHCCLIVAVMPVLPTYYYILTDRNFGTHFFDAAGGGPIQAYILVLWPSLVYIIILPAFGVASEIIPTFARKHLFGRTSMIYAVGFAIAFLSFIVWAHHMFYNWYTTIWSVILYVRHYVNCCTNRC